ncbi:MAG TPA: hypothetical protein VFL41_08515 [Gaiellaceae bacterium]|nr:hypothetical protein [Gaiellaceae bacterium]
MRLTLVCALGALAVAAPAAADVVVGVADSLPKDSPAYAERFFDTMNDVGLTENRISIVWDSQRPARIPDQDALDRAVELAAAHNVRMTFAVYPRTATAITGNPNGTAQFTGFLRELALRYPTVRDFIVGNEPNKALFWQPVFNPNGTGAACGSYQGLLARSYDALKAVDQRITVIGLALGPRGTDNARAPGNLSISPIRCIRDVGKAYRASRRTRPIMDELSFHGHPNSAADPLETGYRWPNAGIPNMSRIKQAIWDAFHGTAQPTFEEAGLPNGPARTLKLRMNEVGWEVTIPPSSRGAYYGQEAVVTTDEGTQAAIYGNLVPLLACDPGVKSVLFFNLVDEPNLARWQSGLLRADWTRRASYGFVKSSITAEVARCKTRPVAWRHAFNVVGARVRFPDWRRARSERSTTWSFAAGAEEGTLYTAAIFRVKRAGTVPAGTRGAISRALRSSRVRGSALKLSGKLLTDWDAVITLPFKRLRPGYYAYGIRLAAELNPARKATFVSRAFRVGEPAKKKKKRAAR